MRALVVLAVLALTLALPAAGAWAQDDDGTAPPVETVVPSATPDDDDGNAGESPECPAGQAGSPDSVYAGCVVPCDSADAAYSPDAVYGCEPCDLVDSPDTAYAPDSVYACPGSARQPSPKNGGGTHPRPGPRALAGTTLPLTGDDVLPVLLLGLGLVALGVGARLRLRAN